MAEIELMEIHEKCTFPMTRQTIAFLLEKVPDKEAWEKELRKRTRLSKKKYQAFLDGEPLTIQEINRLGRYLRRCDKWQYINKYKAVPQKDTTKAKLRIIY